MKSRPLEPGLLETFRLYIVVRLLFVAIAGAFYLYWYRPTIELGLISSICPFLVDIVLLLVLLSSDLLRRWLGGFYLPLSLLMSVVGPIVQVGYVLPGYDVDATFAFLLGFSLLLVPLILAAWQYTFGWVLLLGLSTALLEFLLLSSSVELSLVELRWSTVGLVGRTLLVLFVSYTVSNLVHSQRRQRRELAEANRKLVRYAATLEQLTISQERNRLARELHDTLAHALSGLAVQLDAISALWDSMPPRARHMLDRALSITRLGLSETRRSLQALRATPLEDLGLLLAIRELVESAAARGGLDLDLDLAESLGSLAPEVEQCFYRVAQESLENVVNHAQATKISAMLRRVDDQLVLRIEDDGQGLVASVPSESQFGIKGMKERAELIGAHLEFVSDAGIGTTVRLTYGEGL